MTYSHKYKRKNDFHRHDFPEKLLVSISSLDTTVLITTITILTYILLVFVGAYILLRRTGILPPNAFRKLVWRVLVYSIPPYVVMALERRYQSNDKSDDPFESENSYSATRTFGAKSQAIKNILGMRGLFPTPGSVSKALVRASTTMPKSTALPGLFNRDNECYQNSIIQGLASLANFCDFLENLPLDDSGGDHAPFTNALQAIILGLNSPSNYGRGLWTPWALKSMSSWQQQDAQEYYSRIVDEVEKDVKRTLKAGLAQEGSMLSVGLELDSNDDLTISLNEKENEENAELVKLRNPLEGLQAQRVGCLQCGYVEGLSMIPFNCITLSLGRKNHYYLEELLSSYTDLETISGVECAKCTLLKQETILERLIASRSHDDSADTALLSDAQSRLEAVKIAIQDQDFSEATLSKQCRISAKARVMVDKTKQSVIARAPQSLVVHINRSVFDERTGTQLKNYSQVQFPELLNLDHWSLGGSGVGSDEAVEKWETDPSISMIGDTDDWSEENEEKVAPQAKSPRALYALRSLITHYGTHGDGHYVAWKQDPTNIREGIDTRTWWRLSDDEVVQFDQDVVSRQGGVFMLFYERISSEEVLTNQVPDIPDVETTAIIEEDLDSSSVFLSPATREALDAKLDVYAVPKETSAAPWSNSLTEQSSPTRITSPMRTASEVPTGALESVGSIMNVA